MLKLEFLSSVLRNVVFENKCLLRNHHKPSNDGVKLFLSNTSLARQTHCTTCGTLLSLELSEDDEEIYLVSEY